MAIATLPLNGDSNTATLEKMKRAAFPAPVDPEKNHDVQSTMNFYKDPGDGRPPPQVYPTRVVQCDTVEDLEAVPLTVHDISGREHEFKLEEAGFQFYHHVSKVKDFTDEEEVKRVYYPEIEEILKEITGASRVLVHNHGVRNKEDIFMGPVRKVHIDHSYTDCPKYLRFYLPDEAEEILKGRVQMINFWRPVKQIFKDPFAVADSRTFPEYDKVAQTAVFDEFNMECFILRPRPTHKFYYRYAQTPDIVTIFKSYDSKTDGGPRNCPHSAFTDEQFLGYPTRESIEARAIVIY